VLSPGSRSTPLAVALQSVAGLSSTMHLDERSAGFAALGRAIATGTPVGLICTSGTAAANYLPAISEASHARVPLVVITADRPPEHQRWGVGQSFDQTGLFHAQVREQITMPVGADGGLDHALRAGLRSTVTARAKQGPVHVNWPFRLPLEPQQKLGEVPKVVSHIPDPAQPTVGELEDLASLVAQNPRGLLVAGPRSVPAGPRGRAIRQSILQFAEATGWPVLADVLSGLRGSSPTVVDAADQVVGAPEFADADLVMRIGTTPTAKSIRLWWERLEGAEHVLLDPSSTWHDPSHNIGRYFASDMAALLEHSRPDSASDPSWLPRWRSCGATTRSTITSVLAAEGSWTEIHLARQLVELMGDDEVLFASSSLPVRDVDSFGATTSPVEVMSNRGINGIDGVVATAIGVAQARPSKRVVVYIGDIALLHDVGSVLDAVRQGVDLTIVVPNNDGGGLFSFLPITDAIDPRTYDKLFHTPHGSDFSFLDAAPGISHRPIDGSTFANEFQASKLRRGVTILEAAVSTADRMKLQAKLDTAIDTTTR